MGKFVITDREYPRLPELLLEVAPGFGGSPELRRLDSADWALPSVVCGAFARYVERLHSEAPSSAESHKARVGETFRAIERLASSPDPEVVNALVVDVFEHLDFTADVHEEFHSGLGPSSRALYDRWVGSAGQT